LLHNKLELRLASSTIIQKLFGTGTAYPSGAPGFSPPRFLVGFVLLNI